MIEKYFDASFDLIDEINNLNIGLGHGISFIDNKEIEILKEKNQFRYIFNFPYKEYSIVNESITLNLESFFFLSDNKKYIIPEGSLITSLKPVFNEDTDFKCIISSQNIYSELFNKDTPCYYRYVVPVGNSNIDFRDFECYAYKSILKNKPMQYFLGLLKVYIDNVEYHFEYTQDDNKNIYLIIDSTKPCLFGNIDKVAMSILVAYGFLSNTIYLHEAYIIFSKEKDFKLCDGIYYKSLRDTIKGQYPIFTTNAYSVLVPIYKKEKLELQETARIQEEDWLNKLQGFNKDTFSKLVQNMYNYDSILRACIMTVEASKFPVDIQLAIYCVAFETFSKHIMNTHNIKPQSVIDKKIWNNSLKPLFENLVEEIKENKDIALNTQQVEFLNRKINSFNNPTNKDMLKLPFEILGYTLSDEELKCIDYRNLSLHGSLPVKENEKELDKLFYINLMMHKLCSILILKLAEFDGYIINNIKLHETALNRRINEDGFLKI